MASFGKRRFRRSADTRWVPAAGENRIRSMIEHRPDWCVSRQRAWGVPIAVFVEKKTGELLQDDDVNERIASAFEQEGRGCLVHGSDPASFWAPTATRTTTSR